MAKSIKYTCDGCGAERKEANHWWRVLTGSYFDAAMASGVGYVGSLAIISFDYGQSIPSEGPQHKVQDYCGESCLMKRVAQFTSKSQQ